MVQRSKPDLRAVPLPALKRELRRRGFEVVDPEMAQAVRNGRDATDLIKELGRIASVDFPASLALTRTLLAENGELHSRAERAEREVKTLVDMAVGVMTDQGESNG